MSTLEININRRHRPKRSEVQVVQLLFSHQQTVSKCATETRFLFDLSVTRAYNILNYYVISYIDAESSAVCRIKVARCSLS